jgi:hypothetical protein
MSTAWQALGEELDLWALEGRRVDFWWRDDDAGAPTPALERLLALSSCSKVPLALAAIPQDFEPEALVNAGPQVHVFQHGVDHRNRAGPGEKKTEFAGAEPLEQALLRLRQGRERLEQRAPGRVLPVLVPPWNRLSSPGLLAALPQAGIRGLSRYGARPPGVQRPELPLLLEVNTHVDIIDWRGSRGFAGDDVCLQLACRHLQARRAGTAAPDEPTGWLTHHAVHDEAAWSFMDRLFAFVAERGGVHWVIPLL